MVRVARTNTDRDPAVGDVSSSRVSTSRIESLRIEIGALTSLDLYQLRGRWQEVYHRSAPRFFRREFLIRGIAYQLQVEVHGALSKATHKTLLKIAAAAESGLPIHTALAQRPRAGTRLVRAWKSVVHTVNVLDDGFEWQGRRWRSLSAIAKEISGTNWNGNVFFGLKKRPGEAGDA